MLICKPFSFYVSSQILSKEYWKTSEENNFRSFFRSSKKNKKSISGLGIHICIISDDFEYIYSFNFFEKYPVYYIHLTLPTIYSV